MGPWGLAIALVVVLNLGVQASSFIQSRVVPQLLAARQSGAGLLSQEDAGVGLLQPSLLQATGAQAQALPIQSQAGYGADLAFGARAPDFLGVPVSQLQAQAAAAAVPQLPGLTQMYGQLPLLQPSVAESPWLEAPTQPPAGLAYAPLALGGAMQFPQFQAMLTGSEQAQLSRVATGVQKVSELARSSITQTEQLQEQLKEATDQLRQAAAVEQALLAQRWQAESTARSALEEVARAQQLAREEGARAKAAQDLANEEASKAKTVQAVLDKRDGEIADARQQLNRAEVVAERALGDRRAAEAARATAQAREARAIREVRKAREDVQQAQVEVQQAQADAIQARAAQAAAEEQAARAVVVQAAQAQAQMADEVQSAESNVAEAEQLLADWPTPPPRRARAATKAPL